MHHQSNLCAVSVELTGAGSQQAARICKRQPLALTGQQAAVLFSVYLLDRSSAVVVSKHDFHRGPAERLEWLRSGELCASRTLVRGFVAPSGCRHAASGGKQKRSAVQKSDHRYHRNNSNRFDLLPTYTTHTHKQVQTPPRPDISNAHSLMWALPQRAPLARAQQRSTRPHITHRAALMVCAFRSGERCKSEQRQSEDQAAGSKLTSPSNSISEPNAFVVAGERLQTLLAGVRCGGAPSGNMGGATRKRFAVAETGFCQQLPSAFFSCTHLALSLIIQQARHLINSQTTGRGRSERRQPPQSTTAPFAAHNNRAHNSRATNPRLSTPPQQRLGAGRGGGLHPRPAADAADKRRVLGLHGRVRRVLCGAGGPSRWVPSGCCLGS